MKKAELIEKMAADACISKAAAEKALASFTDSVKGTLKNGNSLTLVGFGTFSTSKRSARTGRNPKTGEAIQIKASTVAKFKAGKALKDAVN